MILIVGVGLTASALIARLLQLRPGTPILAMDVRPHLAGNCFDYDAGQGTRVHRYGPHIFHSRSARIVEFVSQYTDWNSLSHAVTAEIVVDGIKRRVPFPYSRLTADAIGRELSADEVAAAFFHGYSQKMWGVPWEALPDSVRARVPGKVALVPEKPSYFPGQFVGLPRDGYTAMAERMAEGAEVRLGCGPDDWRSVEASHVVYTGRPDLLKLPGARDATLGEAYGLSLPYRTLDLMFAADAAWDGPTSVVNFCHTQVPYTRKTCYRLLTGGLSQIVSTETPRDARPSESAPFYPVVGDENRPRYAQLKEVVGQHYPNVTLAGRLGTHQYLDMDQAIGQGIAVAENLAKRI